MFERPNKRGRRRGTSIKQHELEERLKAIALELGGNPTREEFQERFHGEPDRFLDRKTLSKAHKAYGWNEYTDMVNDALSNHIDAS